MLSLLAAVAVWHAPLGAAPGSSVVAPPGSPVPPLAYHPTRRDSILVFGAHPDDETLGAGGMIHAATTVGARVRVVTFTNGDGYVEGVDVGFRTLFSTPGQFIAYGKRRQQEALAAAAHLGVPPSQVTFLGYPDRGLPALWGSAWNCRHPYTSPYTRRNRSPYPLGYRAQAAYCGENVLEDVETLLREDRPTVIVTHSPVDSHRDHWAAAAFVAAALERRSLEDPAWTKMVHVWTYLVHHGMWPVPEAYAPDLFLNPPRDLAGTGMEWAQFPIGLGDEAAKRLAIREYSSQVELLRTYMLSFVRRNELFARPPQVWPSRLEGAGLSLAIPEGWDRVPPAIRVPAGGSLLHAAEGSVNLESIALAQDSAHLYVALRLRHRAIREAQYRLEFRLLYRDGHLGRLPLLFQVPRSLTARHTLPGDLTLPSGAVARSVGPRIYVVLPLGPLGDPVSALFQAATAGPLKTLIDRSPWTLVHLDLPRRGHPAGNSPALPPVWPRSEDLMGIRGH
ncbi:MAG TPA: PIG-L family deacetylase [bacterium]|nr:PIG-L family deacetylase [bacterium]